MWKLIAFALVSAYIVYVSRASLLSPRSHGFYRFFVFEGVAALVLLNVDVWFWNPFSWHQLVSWFLLIVSIVPLVLGLQRLMSRGKVVEHRDDDAQLLAFEKTTALVTTGIYRHIRHPMYSSLLLLTWGIFFKMPHWPGAVLALAITALVIATAKADEAECIRFFGPAYQAYMERTKRFVPLVF